MSVTSDLDQEDHYFGCIAALDDSFAALALAERPCVSLPVAFDRPRCVEGDGAGWHRNSVDWKPRAIV